MTNQELEVKIKEIIAIPNYFDMVVAVRKFNKTYKKTPFYKTTRQPLLEVIKCAKAHYFFQMDDLFNLLQTKISNLNVDNLNQILNQLGEVFGRENADILSFLDSDLLQTIIQH